MSYTWKNNLACLATYKILERDDRLNQFDELYLPFSNAGSFKIASLPFYPLLPSNELRLGALQHFAAKFIQYLFNDYVIKKQNQDITTEKLFKDVVACLGTDNATLADLAGTLDDDICFPDEQAG